MRSNAESVCVCWGGGLTAGVKIMSLQLLTPKP
jgi:hypothetical protein